MSHRVGVVDAGRLARWCVEHLGSPPVNELFRSGHLSGNARGREFSTDELQRSRAAGVWTRAYDAKYQHAVGQRIASLSQDEARERLSRIGTATFG